MAVALRNSLVLKIKKTQTSKTFTASRHTFITSMHIWLSFGAISLKCSFFSPLNFIKQKAKR